MEVGRLSVEEGLTLGYDRRRECHIADLEALARYLMERFSGEGGFLVFEAPFVVRLRRPLTPRAVFVLRCEPRELARRLKSKGYKPAKIMENLWAEILDYPLQEALAVYGPSKVHELDVSRGGLKEAVSEAVGVLKRRRRPSHGGIDWLGKLERDGILEKLSSLPAGKALRWLLRE